MEEIKLEIKNKNEEIIFSVNINNIPSEIEFKSKANIIYFECLLEFIDFINYAKDLNEDRDKNIGVDFKYIENKFRNSSLAQLIKKIIIDIISKLHHASEIYLKSSILKNNPLILLSKTNYFDNHEDINFLEEQTIEAYKLIQSNKKIYGENFFSNSFGCDFENIFNQYRKIRNKNIHSVSLVDEIDIEGIKKMFLAIFEIFNSNKKFSNELYKYLNESLKVDVLLTKSKEGFDINNIFFTKEDKENGFDYRRKIHVETINFLDKNLSKKQFSTIFAFDKNSHRKICPNCEKEYRFTINNNRYREDECPNKYENNESDLDRSLKSLIEVNGIHRKCIVCGIVFNNSEMIKNYCECCEKETIFFKGNRKIGETCLKCGCVNNLDFFRDNK